MRSPYTCLYREIWNDEKIWSLSERAQLVYAYLISAPVGNGLGCYKGGMEMLAEDKRMESKAFRKAFGEVLQKGLVEYDEEHRVVWIPKYIDRNEPGNPNVLKSWGRVFAVLPDCDLKGKCYRATQAFAKGKSKAFNKAFNKAFPKAFPEAFGKESGNMALSPSPSPSPPSKKKEDVCGNGFENFYADHPRKKNKPDALKAWKQTAKIRPENAVLMASHSAHVQSYGWTKNGGQYIPLAASWLRAHGWNDKPEEAPSHPSKPQDREPGPPTPTNYV